MDGPRALLSGGSGLTAVGLKFATTDMLFDRQMVQYMPIAIKNARKGFDFLMHINIARGGNGIAALYVTLIRALAGGEETCRNPASAKPLQKLICEDLDEVRARVRVEHVISFRRDPPPPPYVC